MTRGQLIRRRRLAQRLLRTDARGAAMVEFAIAAPFLIAILVGTVDLSRGFATKALLHSALARTIELAQIGSNSGNFDYLKTEAAAAAGVPVANVTLTKWLECNTTTKAFDGTCAGGEQMAKYLTVTITNSYDPLFSAKLFGESTDDALVTLTVSDSLRIQ